MRCRTDDFKVCTQGSKVTKVWPTSCCCEHTHITQMCVAEYVSSGLHPTFKGYRGFADQVLLRANTCALQKLGLHPGFEILSSLRRPPAAVNIHMCVAD